MRGNRDNSLEPQSGPLSRYTVSHLHCRCQKRHRLPVRLIQTLATSQKTPELRPHHTPSDGVHPSHYPTGISPLLPSKNAHSNATPRPTHSGHTRSPFAFTEARTVDTYSSLDLCSISRNRPHAKRALALTRRGYLHAPVVLLIFQHPPASLTAPFVAMKTSRATSTDSFRLLVSSTIGF